MPEDFLTALGAKKLKLVVIFPLFSKPILEGGKLLQDWFTSYEDLKWDVGKETDFEKRRSQRGREGFL